MGHFDKFKQGALATFTALASVWASWVMSTSAHAQTPPVINCQGRPVTQLDFTGPTLLSGTALQVGAIYQYANVAPGVNARVEVIAFVAGGSLGTIDNDTGLVNYFQPELTKTANQSSAVDFRFSFVDSILGLPVEMDLAVSSIDVDGNSVNVREYVEFEDTLVGYVLNSTTKLDMNIAPGPTPGNRRFESEDFVVAPGIDPTAEDNIVTVFYTDETAFDFRIGALGSGGQDRLTSLGFDCPNLQNPIVNPTAQEDYGDAPVNNYGNPIHTIVDGIRLGASNNADTAAFNSSTATGDTGDDGVIVPNFLAGEAKTIPVQVTGASGYLQSWFDWNDDGDFTDAGEQVATNVQDTDNDGIINLPVDSPSNAQPGNTIARFRWATVQNVTYQEQADDGEVEDYQFSITAPSPFTCDATLYQSIAMPTANDPSQLSSISVSGSSETVTPVGNTSHGVSYNAACYNVLDNFIYAIERTPAGDTLVRVENNGVATRMGLLSQALGSQPGAGDMDESGNLYVRVGGSEDLFRINVTTQQVTVIPSSMSTFAVADFAYNPTDGLMYGVASNSGQLYSLNPANGAIAAIGAGDPSLTVFGAQYFDNAGHLYGLENATGDLYRFELTDGTAVIVATGGSPASGNDGASCRGGTLSNADYTDAPASFGAAAHLYIPGLILGNAIDFETNAQYSADASAEGVDDDGLFIPEITQGQSGTIKARVIGTGGYLQGWIDWNDNGTFESLEQVATDLQDTDNDGQIFIPVTAPPTAATTETIVRFRWSTDMGLGASEFANDGEVEDYAITLRDPANFTCPASLTLSQTSGNADTVVVAAGQSTRALGPLAAAGTDAVAVSAVNSSANPNLTLSLTHLVPEGAPITFSLARNDAGGDSNIDVSSDGSAYATLSAYNYGVEEVLEYITVIAPAGGVQFVRVQRNGGSVRIDGIQYDHACLPPAAPNLQADKTVAVYDPASTGLYALPGNDVIYSISISNAGNGAADTDSIELIDSLPSDIEFWNGDIDAGGPDTYPGTDPVGFTQPAGTGMSLTYGTDIRFGTGGTAPADFSACTAVAQDNTYRPDLTYICFNPKGTLAAGDPDPEIELSFRARIK